MIDREYNIIDATQKLVPFLEANQSGYQGLRRRAVLYKANNRWLLLICTVEAITNDTKEVDVCATRSYSQVVLYEDWLPKNDLLDFVKQIKDGRISLGDQAVEAGEAHRQWNRDQVPSINFYMARAGQVFTVRFDRSNTNTSGVLIAPDQPYYSDITEAVRDWLPFPVYHGSSDARNGEIVLLLPETRAYLQEMAKDGETLDVKIAGTRAKDLPLLLNGAWWESDGIHHFQKSISNDHERVPIPTSALRVEFVLTDRTGTIYDYLREDNYKYEGIEMDRSQDENTSLVEVVREACQSGEGLHIEFKPFIELGGRKDNQKLNEIIKTVVAFANTKGGRIFLGINDDCELKGINQQLAKWVAGAADTVACKKYLGALRGRIRDVAVGDPVMTFTQTIVDDCLVGIIEVQEAREKPICVQQDHYLYVRRGSSNKKLPPDEWKSVLGSQQLHYPI